jgi:hypothetical protein
MHVKIEIDTFEPVAVEKIIHEIIDVTKTYKLYGDKSDCRINRIFRNLDGNVVGTVELVAEEA